METQTLVNQAQSKDYSNFEQTAKEMLKTKVKQALSDSGYFDRLNVAQGITEVDAKDKDAKDGDKETYKEFYNGMLKKFGAKTPEELDDKQKKKFFDEIDAGWDGENEND